MRHLAAEGIPAQERRGMSVGRYLRDYPTGSAAADRHFHRFLAAYESNGKEYAYRSGSSNARLRPSSFAERLARMTLKPFLLAGERSSKTWTSSAAPPLTRVWIAPPFNDSSAAEGYLPACDLTAVRAG